MTNPLDFDALKGILHRRITQLPDHRHKGPNTRYAIQDAAFGAFGIFFTQSPSFLEDQRRLQHSKGQNNAHTLLGRAGAEDHVTPCGLESGDAVTTEAQEPCIGPPTCGGLEAREGW